MTRRGHVYFKDRKAGLIEETDEGTYIFTYDPAYLAGDHPPISLTLPLCDKPHHAKQLFPFFDGLIPEGWLLELSTKTWRLNSKDRMGLLLAACRDCIGAVSVFNAEEGEAPR